MFEKYFFNIIHYCQLVTYRIEFDPNGTKCLGHYPSCWKQHLETSKGKVFKISQTVRVIMILNWVTPKTRITT